jgi:hypothetical protein
LEINLVLVDIICRLQAEKDGLEAQVAALAAMWQALVLRKMAVLVGNLKQIFLTQSQEQAAVFGLPTTLAVALLV